MPRAHFFVLSAIALTNACSDPAATRDPDLMIEGGSERTIQIGAQEQLRARAAGATNGSIQWLSSDPSIAHVDATGLLRVATTYTACNWVTPGECQVRITAIMGTLRADQILTVMPFEPTLEVFTTRLDLETGDTARIHARVLLEQTAVPWCTVGYASHDPDVAQVGSGGMVAAKDEGTTLISVNVAGVLCPRLGVDVQVMTHAPRYVLAILPGDVATLAAGETLQLIAQVTNWKTVAYPAGVVVWMSSNPEVASVSSDGLLRAGSCNLAPSCRATITARSGRLVATKEITLAQ